MGMDPKQHSAKETKRHYSKGLFFNESGDTIDIVLLKYIKVDDGIKHDDRLLKTSRDIIQLDFKANIGLLSETLISSDRSQYYPANLIGDDGGFGLLLYEWKKFLEYIKEGYGIRIWVNETAGSLCGLYYLTHFLKDYGHRIEVITIPKGETFYTLKPKDVRAAYDNKVILSEELKQKWSSEWERLFSANKPIRVIENGKVVSRLATEYDYLLDYYIGSELVREFDIRRKFLLEHADICEWLELRLRHFLNEGLIETVNKLDAFEEPEVYLKKTNDLVDKVFYADKIKRLYEKELEEKCESSFSEKLLEFIRVKGYTEPEIYKTAKIDRRHFSKIRSNTDYMPSKSTVIVLALALKLSKSEAEDLLNAAGYTLSYSQKQDVIIMNFLSRGNHSLEQINDVLFQMGLPVL